MSLVFRIPTFANATDRQAKFELLILIVVEFGPKLDGSYVELVKTTSALQLADKLVEIGKRASDRKPVTDNFLLNFLKSNSRK